MEDNFWAKEWAKLLELTTEVLTSADAVMDAMKGDLGPEITSTADAAVEITNRIAKWHSSRNALIEYARNYQKVMEN